MTTWGLPEPTERDVKDEVCAQYAAAQQRHEEEAGYSLSQGDVDAWDRHLMARDICARGWAYEMLAPVPRER